ncbi:SpoIID/LytB domain-containing protein [Pannus brasiliensis CCIBt3594]|uniref:SpoIID/LytB domain-containing protein n=1 Tax=Pannus brasiliensis CCIBt3594 TaxID=1427578 RepID=A0AAW9QPJ6_9CHRO
MNTRSKPSFLGYLCRRMPSGSWLILVFWMLMFAPVQAAVELRIAISKNAGAISVGSSTDAVVKDGSGRVLGELGAMNATDASVRGKGVGVDRFSASQLIIEPKDDGVVWINDRWYRGRTRLLRMGSGVTAINLIDLEQYLYSVVGAEAIPSWPLEALKTQAVAARTYAIYKSNTSGNRFYDLDTTTRTQVYKGMETEFTTTHDAVNSTEGQIMTYNGKAILAVFHSSSGGHTENVEDVWNSSLPYLRGVVDYDQVAPVFQWSKTFTASELGRLLGGVGRVRSLVPQRVTPLGRIIKLRVVGDRGSKLVSDDQLRQVLDLRSTLFTVSESNNTFEIDGRGYGHGIGLSQWGAFGLASQGQTYDRILTHYYQNAQLTALGDR